MTGAAAVQYAMQLEAVFDLLYILQLFSDRRRFRE